MKRTTLPKLEKVEAYVNKNHHLTDIPTADAMKENGVAIGELNTKLLQKVEELTLYLIDQNKQITNQNKRAIDQQKQLDDLKKELVDLKKAYSQEK